MSEPFSAAHGKEHEAVSRTDLRFRSSAPFPEFGSKKDSNMVAKHAIVAGDELKGDPGQLIDRGASAAPFGACQLPRAEGPAPRQALA